MASYIETLISEFNANPDNTELIEYLSKNGIFNTTGKSRVEIFHSQTMCRLLAGTYLTHPLEGPGGFDIVPRLGEPGMAYRFRSTPANMRLFDIVINYKTGRTFELSEEDKCLLEDFFKKHKDLILVVTRATIDKETYDKLRKEVP